MIINCEAYLSAEGASISAFDVSLSALLFDLLEVSYAFFPC